MKQIRWNAVSRKRLRNARYTDPEYVVGYDLDTHDMDELVAKFNANNITETESNRLGRHVLTLMQIVVENPKFLSRPKEDYEELTDYMFLKMWGAIKYIDITKGRAYSYLYRSGYTAVASYYQNKNKVDDPGGRQVQGHRRLCCEARHQDHQEEGRRQDRKVGGSKS